MPLPCFKPSSILWKNTETPHMALHNVAPHTAPNLSLWRSLPSSFTSAALAFFLSVEHTTGGLLLFSLPRMLFLWIIHTCFFSFRPQFKCYHKDAFFPDNRISKSWPGYLYHITLLHFSQQYISQSDFQFTYLLLDFLLPLECMFLHSRKLVFTALFTSLRTAPDTK